MQNSDMPQRYFGNWLARANNTVYQAATDGFAMGFATAGGVNNQVLTDGSNPPTTVRQHGTTSPSMPDGALSPVRKGDYWKTVNCTTVYWIPLEP